MPAGTYNIQIDQNATFQQNIWWSTQTQPPVSVDVTGYTGKMQIRTAVGGSDLIDLTTANGGIIMGGADGLVTLFLTAAQTAALTWSSGVYDLVIVSPAGFATRLLEGTVTVNPAVTTI